MKRSRLIARAAASAAAAWFGLTPAADSSMRLTPSSVKLPLLRCGSGFCTEYYVNGQRFRAVVDTGSPFLLVDGTCGTGGTGPAGRVAFGAVFGRSEGAYGWGCFEAGQNGGALADFSTEMFGGQNIDVEWRRGMLRLPGSLFLSPRESEARRRGARPGPWTREDLNQGLDLLYPINFGVVRALTNVGGSGAVYLGLAKDRAPGRTRQSFLEQTDLVSFRLDFLARELTLSRRALIRGDSVPLVDLRDLGAPISPPAAQVERLRVNGAVVPLERPTFAVFDSGTTGLTLSDAFPALAEMRPAAIRDVVVEFKTAAGRTVKVAASSRRRRRETAGSADRRESFDLIVTTVKLPWFTVPRAPRYREYPAPDTSP